MCKELFLQRTVLSWTTEFPIWVKRGKRCTRRILPCYLICRKHFTCPLIGQRPLHGFSSQKRIRKTQRQIRQIRKSIKKSFTTLINDDEYTLKPLIQRSVRRVGAHKSARYVHQIHDVTFGRKPGLTVFGFFTQHHFVPGPEQTSFWERKLTGKFCSAKFLGLKKVTKSSWRQSTLALQIPHYYGDPVITDTPAAIKDTPLLQTPRYTDTRLLRTPQHHEHPPKARYYIANTKEGQR